MAPIAKLYTLPSFSHEYLSVSNRPMKNLKKALVLSLAMLCASFCHAEQFDIPNGDIAALKTAILASNTNNKPDTIHLAPFGMYRFTTVDHNFLGDNALPTFEKDGSDVNSLTIFGNGATLMRDPSIAVLRLLYFLDCKVAIYDINLIGGTTLQFDNDGGAIRNSSARITMQNCLLKDNHASEGGAVSGISGSFTAKNCTFIDNVATAGTGSVIVTMYGTTVFENCVVVNNRCLNVNVPAAIFNFIPLNSNTPNDNIYLKNCIVAKNIYDNLTSPDNGKEFDIAGAVYTQGGNLIGSYPVVTQVFYPTFRQGQPSTNNDYVGTEAAPIDPLLGTLGDHGLFTDFYDLLPGSKASLISAGIRNVGVPAVASNGIVPAEAYPGDMITMTGINLSAINKVQFAGAPTTSTGITSTNRTVTVPVHTNARTGQILLMDAVPHFIFTIQKFKVKTVTTPAAPSNLSGIGSSTSSIMLAWDDLTNEDFYQIEYKRIEDNTYLVVGRVGANITTYVAEGLSCHNAYNFRVIALGHGTQSDPSNVIQSTPSPLPTPALTPTSTEGCAGGSIALDAPAGFASYTWNTGETTETIHVGNSGDYSVQVTDGSGCASNFSLPVSIVFHTTPSPLSGIDGSDSVLGGSSSNIFSVDDPGNITFEWVYDGTGATLNAIQNVVSIDFAAGATSGTLSVTIGNTCGKIKGATLPIAVESVVTGSGDEFSRRISIFPNPSKGKLRIDVPVHWGKYNITIRDLVGRAIYHRSGNESSDIELANPRAGVYLVVIERNNEAIVKKLIVHDGISGSTN